MKAPLRIVLGLAGLAQVAWAVPVAPQPPDLIPSAGRVAPRNTKIWVFAASESVQVFDSRGNEVPVMRTTIGATFSPGVSKLTPVTQLEPGQYSLRTFFGVDSTFTVTDTIDTTAPAAPTSATAVAKGRVGEKPSEVLVTGADADSFMVVLFDGQSWEASSVPAMSARGSVIISGLPAGETRLKVLLVDAAGNASEPVELVATVPAERACSVGPVLPLSLLALMLLRRRRRGFGEGVLE